MEYAKSMLLGGDIISAKTCDHQSAKELSLVCPLCSSAVFYCGGSIRETTLRNGTYKTQIVSPSFHHYKTGVFDLDCENRVKTKQGRQEINRQIIESKNQRLKLYNERLWDLIATDRNIGLTKITKTLNKKWGKGKIENMAITLKKTWKEFHCSDEFKELFKLAIEINYSADKEEIINNLMDSIGLSRESAEEEWQKCSEYSSNFSRQYHQAICHEIYDFLDTLTSGYLWFRITKACIKSAVVIYRDLFLDTELEHKIKLLQMQVVSLIYGTHWVKIIKAELNLK